MLLCKYNNETIIFDNILVLMAQLFLCLLLLYRLEALSFLSTLFPLLCLLFVKVFHKDQSFVLSYNTLYYSSQFSYL